MDELYESIRHESDDGFALKIYKTAGAHLHWHEEYEFVLANESSANCIINGRSIRLEKGDALLIRGGVLHSFYSENEAPITAIVASPTLFSCGDGDVFDSDIAFREVYRADCENDAKVIDILKSAVTIYETKPFAYKYILKSKFICLFASLIENKCFSYDKTKSFSKPSELKTLMSYIHQNYSEKISLDALSEISFYSKSYIIKLFKKYTSLTPAEYIIGYRLAMAKNALKSTNSNNLAIAISCGFNSESYFVRTFKRHFGMTPQEYRKKLVFSAPFSYHFAPSNV